MGKINSRSKGKRGELQFRDVLRGAGFMARRGQQYAGSAEGESPDVVHNIPGVHIEVKWVERLNLAAAMAQAKQDCGGKVPVVAHKRNGEEWLVTVPASAIVGWWQEMFLSGDDYSDL